MRCAICDSLLTDEEVRYNSQHKDFDPCGTCREVIHGVFREDRDEGTLADEGNDDGGLSYVEDLLDMDREAPTSG